MVRGTLPRRYAPGRDVARRAVLIGPCRVASIGRPRRGLTLIEMLVAMAITLLMMGGVITMFGTVTESISGSRATTEMSGRARAATRNLQQDLAMVTAEMLPPLRPEQGMGYFEYAEGPEWDGKNLLLPSSTATSPKSALGDTDDLLMMTVRSRGSSFAGRVVALPHPNNLKEPRIISMDSAIAEVAWWAVPNGSDVVVPNPINGQDYSYKTRTLYRRVLLVGTPPETAGGLLTGWINGRFRLDQLNGVLPSGVCDPMRFFGVFDSDLSVHFELVNENGKFVWYAVANTLADLTKRENRHGHLSLCNRRPGDAAGVGEAMVSSSPACYPFAVGVAEPYYSDFEKLGRFNGSFRKDFDDLNRNGSYDPMGEPYWDWDDNQQYNASTDTFVDFSRDGRWTNSWDWNAAPLLQRMLAPLSGTRRGEDVMLDNVLAFDVRAFDPKAEVRMASGAANERLMLVPSDLGYATGFSPAVPALGAYVDLSYGRNLAANSYRVSQFSEFPDRRVYPRLALPTYDTWSLHYEYDGFDQDGDNVIDEGTDGIDNVAANTDPSVFQSANNGAGTATVAGVDDPTEREAPPPYGFPLRGIQVRIRQYETSTRQVRETTISQDFLPE